MASVSFLSALSLSTIFPPGLFSGSAAYPKQRIDNFDQWLSAITQPTALVELAVLLACALLAWHPVAPSAPSPPLLCWSVGRRSAALLLALPLPLQVRRRS